MAPQRKALTSSKPEPPSGVYTISYEAERSYGGTRYYWTICRAEAPDELVSWGYSRTEAEAALAAQNEVNDLSAGLTQGGRGTIEDASRR